MNRRLWIGLFAFIGGWLGWMAGGQADTIGIRYVAMFAGVIIGSYAGWQFFRNLDKWSRR